MILVPFLLLASLLAQSKGLEWVSMSQDNRAFVFQESGQRFVPWGLNYDHDERNRLLEDYWESDWSKMEEDFREMKELGANVVRIQLQLGKFMKNAMKPNEKSLAQLERLVCLAEKTGLYLDLTGLGNFRKSDVPTWLDKLSENERWKVQAHFWEAVASRTGNSPAIFCYNLMNEPAVPGEKDRLKEWTAPPFEGTGFHYIEFITLEPASRPRVEIGQQWIRTLTKAIRKHDPKHLITVGLFLVNDQADHLPIGTTPEQLAPEVDFLSVHIYPRQDAIPTALNVLKRLSIVRKPVVIEETAPLHCSVPCLQQFVENSKACASGWMLFYWGKTPQDCRASSEIADALTLDWLEFFQRNSLNK